MRIGQKNEVKRAVSEVFLDLFSHSEAGKAVSRVDQYRGLAVVDQESAVAGMDYFYVLSAHFNGPRVFLILYCFFI